MDRENKYGNLFDYLNWRGDLSFEASPFNEIDSLILSELVYVNFDDCFKQGMTIRQLSQAFKDKHLLDQREFSLISEADDLAYMIQDYPRFQNIIVFDYRNDIDYQLEKQFAAMSFVISKRHLYIAYRGTDDTILGWKEDFNMTYQDPIPSQNEAVDYLHDTIKVYKQYQGTIKTLLRFPMIDLGGHSKGGNLAIYSAVHVLPSIQKQIRFIDNFDGPGFQKSFIESPSYQQIKNRIRSFLPCGSVIGRLLHHDHHHCIVESFENNMMQHSGFTWKIRGNHFIETEQFNEDSHTLKLALDDILNSLNPQERQEFVDEMFMILKNANIETIGDMTEKTLNKVFLSLKGLTKMSSQYRNIILSLMKYMIIYNSRFDVSNRFLTKNKEDA